jgi:hypothetical protein
MNFYDKLIEATKNYYPGHFPCYPRYAYEEELWATLAAHLGGNLYELCCWKDGEYQTPRENDPKMIYAGADHDGWRGRFKKYPVRNGPEIDLEEVVTETSIVHPVKEMNDIRKSFAKKRLGLIF